MAEQSIPNTGDPRVDAALDRIRGKFTDLEDTMVVQGYFKKQTKEHAQLLAGFISGLQAEAAERRVKDAALDARVDKLVSAIGELIRQGSRPS